VALDGDARLVLPAAPDFHGLDASFLIG